MQWTVSTSPYNLVLGTGVQCVAGMERYSLVPERRLGQQVGLIFCLLV